MALRRLGPHRGSLLLTFGAWALAVTVLAGVAIQHFASSAMRERAIGDAREAAQELSYRIQNAVAADPRFARDPERRLKRIVRVALAAGYGPATPTSVTVAGAHNLTVGGAQASLP